MSDRASSASSEVLRISLAARVFTLSAIGAAAAVADTRGPVLLITVSALAAAAQLATAIPWLSALVPTVLEATAVSFLASTLSGGGVVAMPYLAVPALIGGVLRGARGALAIAGLEVVVVSLGLVAAPGERSLDYQHAAIWFITSVGLGLLGSSIHRLVTANGDDESYRVAVGLIEQLHRVSERLPDGLEVGTIASNVLARARAFVPLETAALVTPDATGRWNALRYAGTAAPDALRDLILRVNGARVDGKPWSNGKAVVVPLTREDNIVAWLVGRGHDIDPDRVGQIDNALTPDTLRLDAALLFAGITASATHEERQRLAREIHDGLAQDLASLGYLIDGVDVTAADANAHLDGIRDEITRVLQEVRHSVFSLRADVTDTRTLGQGVSALAQHVRTHSPIHVHELVDEGTGRLRVDVETQLLRITQEAMNNARRHSGAANIWVRCLLDAPHAEIEVLDDGAGLGPLRDDSHGLAIMRERADRIGAHLEIDSRPDSVRGTRVLVRLGGRDDH